MKFVHSLDYYLLRTAALPLEEAFAFMEESQPTGQQLCPIMSEPFIRSAFYLASPDFTEALDNYLERGEPWKADEKIIKSFYKYYVRMSSRCTPFGLFAGCAVGAFADSTHIAFRPEKMRTISRLDMYYVSALSEYINRLPQIKNQLLYYPNETLYAVGSDYRYIEFSTVKPTRKYRLSSFRGSDLISGLLAASREGISYAALVASLQAQGFDEAATVQFIDNLIESQILVSDLLPSITGEEYFGALLRRLRALAGTGQLVADLEAVHAAVKAGSWTPAASAQVRALLGKYVPTQTKDMVQTDLFFCTEHNTISRKVIEEVAGLVEECVSLQPFGSSTGLRQFITKFEAKYGEQEVPLLLALDGENGVGFQVTDPGASAYMPLLENIHVPAGRPPRTTPWGADKDHALRLILDAIQTGSRVVDLQKPLAAEAGSGKKGSKLPASMFLFGSLLAGSTEELDAGHYQFVLNSAGGPSGANLLARFCHGDAQLEARVRETLQQEEELQPEVLFAEVVHLPDGRTGNVIMRPALRRYEIPILTQASVEEEYVIRLSDLLVSVSGGKVVLRSRRLNKRVIPRLTNAHNYARGLPVYRFLCELQSQGLDSLQLWNWSVFRQQPFLPRVQYGKLILSRATWNLKKSEFLEGSRQEGALAYLAALRDRRQLPDKVSLVEGDNELLLSMASATSLRILADKLCKRDVVLQEYLFRPDNCFVKDARGSYAHELVIPFCTQREPAAALPRPEPAARPAPALKRDFQVGEPWLYYKIFTGNKTADRLMVEGIKPLAESLLIEGVIEKWFYLRYDEQGHHLRVRFFHGGSDSFWSTVIQRMEALLRPYRASGQVHQVQLDTYQREVERYGFQTMELSESLFFYDSIAVTEFLELIDGDRGEEYRWLFALLNVDRLLDDFGMSLYEKFQLVSQLREYFYQEANRGSQSKKLWISLNDGYRARARDIRDLLEREENRHEDVREAVDCFRRRSERNLPVTQEIIRLLRQPGGKGPVSLSSLVSSHVHMTLNRTFLAKQRIHETVIYHFLAKYYDSRIAREEHVSTKSNKKVIT
ncbi:lantibiotic dehydratase [Pontibacter indicus]|uniref:Thiopeptide-type bacteriocin biosynthesis domain-containing protein n=1 Tax=Pontibacter indicus TaxID=1317125 RepID=A0A1R3XPY6_9BACT|nr:lantibiotic dehydratase [Pontibacter indicus]SIT93979.1 thiopeptide-type bacteriocin biosynthesis domain-containing protein [Pontibacter indicus]